MEKEREEGEQNRFLPLIDVAFDLSSVGLGVQIGATRQLHRLGPTDALPEEAQLAAGKYDSNYLINPYVFRLLDERYKISFPFCPSPAIDSHRKLLLATEEEYRALFWQIVRATLAGDRPTSVDDPRQPITQIDDLRPYLETAQKRELIITVRKSGLPPRVVKRPTHFYALLSSLGFSLTPQYSNLEREMLLSPAFRPQLLKACQHKLGGMLAVTEQILYHANAAGRPIPASYKPESQTHQANWQKMFGEEMPGIEGLYQEALGVLGVVGGRNDDLTSYLFSLDISQYLAR